MSPSSLSIPDASTSSSSTNILNDFSKASSPADRLHHLSERIQSNALFLTRISDTIPRKDRYLRVILGGVDVAILNRTEKWNYKQDYEKFKFIVTCISLVSSLLIWSLTSNLRAFDALFHFLLVWYYCTLTIRESILVANGSNIHRKNKYFIISIIDNDIFLHLKLGGELTISFQQWQLAFY